MTLYSIYSDDKYRSLGFDDSQIEKVFGSNIRNQFSVNFSPVSYADKWQTLDVKFDDDGSGFNADLIPEISVHYGRLYLSMNAYDALKKILANDGEFLPVRMNSEDAFLFNPSKKAEDVDGLNEKLSARNEWADIENTAFHEEHVKDFVVFKTAFDHYISAYCQESLKKTIESAGLKGVIFTLDLGNPFGAGATQ